jgi:hypothetical protein
MPLINPKKKNLTLYRIITEVYKEVKLITKLSSLVKKNQD